MLICMAYIELPSIEYIRQCFRYDEQLNDLVWLERPLDHFADRCGQARANGRWVGKKAGTIAKGLRCVLIKRKWVQVEHIIHALKYGTWPPLANLLRKSPDGVLPDIEYIRQCFTYDPKSGILTWLTRPPEHFYDKASYKMWNTNFPGKRAGSCFGGTKEGSGRIVCITQGPRKVSIGEHRIIWALVTGRWPEAQIDHINGIGSDNRWINLREATPSENGQNRVRLPLNNTSGFLGVSQHKGKWQAHIGFNNHKYGLGRFNTPEEAHAAYLGAKRVLHTFQPKLKLRK